MPSHKEVDKAKFILGVFFSFMHLDVVIDEPLRIVISFHSREASLIADDFSAWFEVFFRLSGGGF